MNYRLRSIAPSIFFSGRALDSMEEVLKRIRVTFGTLKKMEKLLMNVGQSHKTKW